ncbi:hypothetical protein ACNUIZ_16805 [Pseudomonas aeruginosa]
MLALIGLCQGYYSDTRNVNTSNGPSQIVEHSVLVQVEQTNKFGMPETKVVQVRISKRHMDGGLNNVWKMEKGKTVSVRYLSRPGRVSPVMPDLIIGCRATACR